jgi:hypothetical protein
MMPHQFYQVNSITRINQLHFKNMMDLGELLLVEDGGCHETLGPPLTIARQHNNQKHPNHCQKIKTQVLPTA